MLLDTLSDDSHTAQFSVEIEDPGVLDEKAATALDDHNTSDSGDHAAKPDDDLPAEVAAAHPASSPEPSEKSVDDDSGSGIKGRKRKRSKGEVVEQVVKKVMKTVTEGMKECDRMFMERECSLRSSRRVTKDSFNCN